MIHYLALVASSSIGWSRKPRPPLSLNHVSLWVLYSSSWAGHLSSNRYSHSVALVLSGFYFVTGHLWCFQPSPSDRVISLDRSFPWPWFFETSTVAPQTCIQSWAQLPRYSTVTYLIFDHSLHSALLLWAECRYCSNICPELSTVASYSSVGSIGFDNPHWSASTIWEEHRCRPDMLSWVEHGCHSITISFG